MKEINLARLLLVDDTRSSFAFFDIDLSFIVIIIFAFVRPKVVF